VNAGESSLAYARVTAKTTSALVAGDNPTNTTLLALILAWYPLLPKEDT
jgi:hypothetical protein